MIRGKKSEETWLCGRKAHNMEESRGAGGQFGMEWGW